MLRLYWSEEEYQPGEDGSVSGLLRIDGREARGGTASQPPHSTAIVAYTLTPLLLIQVSPIVIDTHKTTVFGFLRFRRFRCCMVQCCYHPTLCIFRVTILAWEDLYQYLFRWSDDLAFFLDFTDTGTISNIWKVNPLLIYPRIKFCTQINKS